MCFAVLANLFDSLSLYKKVSTFQILCKFNNPAFRNNTFIWLYNKIKVGTKIF